jgi:ATP-dependent Clp protease protease subunit
MTKEIDDITAFHNHNLYIPSRTIVLRLPSGEIDHESADEFIKNIHILEQLNHDPIRVFLNCPGGSVIDGTAIYSAILACPALVTGIVLGEASSMGALILCAFDRRLAYPASRFMLHDGTTEVSGTIRDVEKDVESDRLSRLDQYRILAEATGKPAKYWARKLANNYHLSAEQALAEGLIDEII